SSCSGATNPFLFSLGNFANYGDPRVKSRIDRVIFHPPEFESLLTEFYYAAQQIHKGHVVQALGDEAQCDFVLRALKLVIPFLVECKKVLITYSKDERINKLVKTMNTQIKKTATSLGLSEFYGLGVLDISNLTKRLIRRTASDEPPQEVIRLADVVQDQL